MEKQEKGGNSLSTTPKPLHTRSSWEDSEYFPNPDCKECNGSGFIHPPNSLGGAQYERLIRCPAPGCLEDSWRAFTQGAPYQRVKGVTQPWQTFDNFILVPGARDAYFAAKELAHGDAGVKFCFLIIFGGLGNGKTHLCNAFTRVSIERRLPCEMVKMGNFYSKLRAAMDSERGQETADAVLKHYKDIFILVLDDWGIEQGTDWQLSVFDDLMTVRFDNGKVTLLTTNRDIGELPERVRSRFEDTEYGRAVYNKAPDFRQTRTK